MPMTGSASFFIIIAYAYQLFILALAYFIGYFFRYLWIKFGHQKFRNLFLIIPILISFLFLGFPGLGYFIIFYIIESLVNPSLVNPLHFPVSWFMLQIFAGSIVSAIVAYIGFTTYKGEWDRNKKIVAFSSFALFPLISIFLSAPYSFFWIDGIIAALIIAAVIGAFVYTRKNKSQPTQKTL